MGNITTKEAANRLGRSVRTVRYYIAEGMLPATKNEGDRDYKIEEDAVDSLKKQLTYTARESKEDQPW